MFKVYAVINKMTSLLEEDILSIKKIGDKAAKSYQKFQQLISYLESEAQRIKTKDIKSINEDIEAIKKLLLESQYYQRDLELLAEDGDVLEIFKIGEKIKNTLQKIKILEYLTDITPNKLF